MAQKKRVLLSLLTENDGLARLLADELTRSGLMVSAHRFLVDDPMAFAATAKELTSCQAWVVVGSDFASSAVRKALSLCALSVQTEVGSNFPILLSPSSTPPEPDHLPTPLKGCEIVKKGLGAKAAVLAATWKPRMADYRLRAHSLGKLGLWFEVGPQEGFWQGAFFASGAEGIPTAHGVGMGNTIPERSTLHYPVEGMQLAVQGIPCVGFGVKNELNANTSYYVRVSSCPDVLLFGAFPEEDTADLYRVNLV